ncbi:hypothetical protein B0H12DRAFT_1137229 [Mycena haematopus]|nr:hypothetical protein B0H12DRAFT_1137229 [Mycena haematopus]
MLVAFRNISGRCRRMPAGMRRETCPLQAVTQIHVEVVEIRRRQGHRRARRRWCIRGRPSACVEPWARSSDPTQTIQNRSRAGRTATVMEGPYSNGDVAPATRCSGVTGGSGDTRLPSSSCMLLVWWSLTLLVLGSSALGQLDTKRPGPAALPRILTPRQSGLRHQHTVARVIQGKEVLVQIGVHSGWATDSQSR